MKLLSISALAVLALSASDNSFASSFSDDESLSPPSVSPSSSPEPVRHVAAAKPKEPTFMEIHQARAEASRKAFEARVAEGNRKFAEQRQAMFDSFASLSASMFREPEPDHKFDFEASFRELAEANARKSKEEYEASCAEMKRQYDTEVAKLKAQEKKDKKKAKKKAAKKEAKMSDSAKNMFI